MQNSHSKIQKNQVYPKLKDNICPDCGGSYNELPSEGGCVCEGFALWEDILIDDGTINESESNYSGYNY